MDYNGVAVNPGLVTMQAIWSAKNIIIICLVSITLTVPILAVSVFLHVMEIENILMMDYLVSALFGFTTVILS